MSSKPGNPVVFECAWIQKSYGRDEYNITRHTALSSPPPSIPMPMTPRFLPSSQAQRPSLSFSVDEGSGKYHEPRNRQKDTPTSDTKKGSETGNGEG